VVAIFIIVGIEICKKKATHPSAGIQTVAPSARKMLTDSETRWKCTTGLKLKLNNNLPVGFGNRKESL
jgi:hypothetical protein